MHLFPKIFIAIVVASQACVGADAFVRPREGEAERAVLVHSKAAPQATTQNLRTVQNNTIISPELPKADLAFDRAFHYIGGQQVNLYGMADAEQHLFAKGDHNGVIDAFYWVQFEHRVPGDQHTYNYQLGYTTEIGGLSFVYDVKAWPDYATMQNEDPNSDGAAITRLLAKSDLKFPSRTARVRMFHLPTRDHRTELMIIYGEALPEDSKVPLRKEGTDVTQEAPTLEQKLLEDLKSQLAIRPK